MENNVFTPTQRMAQVMIEQRIKQNALAAQIGIPTTTLHTWISRNTDFPVSYTVPLANALGVSPMWLLTGSDEPEPETKQDAISDLNDDELYLLKTFRALDREGKYVLTGRAVEELRRVKAEAGITGEAENVAP